MPAGRLDHEIRPRSFPAAPYLRKASLAAVVLLVVAAVAREAVPLVTALALAALCAVIVAIHAAVLVQERRSPDGGR